MKLEKLGEYSEKTMTISHILRTALLAAALVIINLPLMASPPTTIEIADNSIYFSPCTGENIQLDGTVTIKASFSIKNDIMHVSLQIKEKATGIGLVTGNQYRVNGESIEESNLKLVNNTGDENAVLTSNVIGKGDVVNEHLKSTFHVTVNANGTLTVQRASLSDTCQ